jgi:murein DD-endopeptidase MepM/ murein hydrolase activator NlpD
MIYPIKDWKKLKRGYTFGVATFYSKFHLGLDVIAPSGTPILAWQDLTVVKFAVGKEGGNTAYVLCPGNKRLFRLMHLKSAVKPGKYKQGQVMALVGNTGSMSRGAHLHLDISKNGILALANTKNFEDPEKYFDAFVKKA